MQLKKAMVRAAKEEDAEGACQVLRRSIAECCVEDHGNDPSLLDTWLANKTPEKVRGWINAASNYAIVASVDENIVGVAMMSTSGEITLLYLLPEARFLGLGKALLAELESRGRQLGLGELRLSSTKTARQFYSRNGFESAGPPDACSGVQCYPMVKSLLNR